MCQSAHLLAIGLRSLTLQGSWIANIETSLLRLASLQRETFSVVLRVLYQLASFKLSQNQEATGENCP